MNLSLLINPSLSAPEGEVFLHRRNGPVSDRAASRPPKGAYVGDPNVRGVRPDGQSGAGAHRTWRAAFPPGAPGHGDLVAKARSGAMPRAVSSSTSLVPPSAKPPQQSRVWGGFCSSGTSPLIAPLMGSVQRGDADARDLLSWMKSKEVFCHPVMSVQDIVNATL